MKKQIVALALVAGLSMATVASANWGRGGHGYGGWGGYGDCPMQGQMMPGMMQQLDPEAKAKVSKFFKDNQALHKQIAMKRGEKQALMQSENPDPQAVAKVTGELFDLHATMMDKAEAAGVSQYLGPMGGRGMGRGMMGGGMMGGQGGGMMGGQGMGQGSTGGNSNSTGNATQQ